MIIKPPKISIVTTCYQAMPFLEECVESIQAQDWPNIEHIVQDGASDDGTQAYLKNLKFPNISWWSAPDKGVSQGLNRAFTKVTGEFMLVLNADDVLLPHACTWAVKQFEKYPDAAVIYGDEHIIDAQGELIIDYVAPDYEFEKLICVEIVPPAQAAFIRCSMFKDVGFHVDESIQDCCDFEMWVRLGCKYPFVHVPEYVTKFRWHNNKSRRPDQVHRHVFEKQSILDRFFALSENRQKNSHLIDRAKAGLFLWASESCFLMDAYDPAKEYIKKALCHSPEPTKFCKYFFKTLEKRPDFLDLLKDAPQHLKDALPRTVSKMAVV